MVSTRTFLFVALAAVVSAAPPCPPPDPPNSTVNYTLPSIGGGAPDLVPPADNLVVKKIAVGHGIQNYSCGSTTGDSIAAGAVAVLYDVTSFYPGTKRTGIRKHLWDSLPSRALWEQPLPLNKLAGSQFGADPVAPFPRNPAADLRLRLRGLPAAARFLGHHYFDIEGVDSKSAPATADKGVLGTGAVPWLRLDDDGRGGSRGVASVFRVVTAGGNPQSCSVAGEGVQSIPYTAFYWFYG